MKLTYDDALRLWARGLLSKPYRTGPGPHDFDLEDSRAS